MERMPEALTGYNVRYNYLKCTGKECQMRLLDMTHVITI